MRGLIFRRSRVFRLGALTFGSPGKKPCLPARMAGSAMVLSPYQRYDARLLAQTRSQIVAIPCPPPMHIVASPYFPPTRCNS